jgi:hypothetical protein
MPHLLDEIYLLGTGIVLPVPDASLIGRDTLRAGLALPIPGLCLSTLITRWTCRTRFNLHGVDCTTSAPPASPLPGLSLTTDLARWLLFWPLIFGLRLFWFQHRHFDFWLGYILGLFGFGLGHFDFWLWFFSFGLGYILGFFGFGLRYFDFWLRHMLFMIDHLGVMMNSAINGVLHMSHHVLDLIHQSLDLTLCMMELLLQGLDMMGMMDLICLMNMLYH